ncbi:xylose isomerase domain protein TIM barrel [Striga asiatica]|uniref:Xylose isomerase domain protein TIM barrel n=1 Tax=Striga asiatica TaxID=4170 RepID=A0A5A7RIW8_STRAF|nr:xylose isomerase domain protein TIM barrel [Striga asiatica]
MGEQCRGISEVRRLAKVFGLVVSCFGGGEGMVVVVLGGVRLDADLLSLSKELLLIWGEFLEKLGYPNLVGCLCGDQIEKEKWVGGDAISYAADIYPRLRLAVSQLVSPSRAAASRR